MVAYGIQVQIFLKKRQELSTGLVRFHNNKYLIVLNIIGYVFKQYLATKFPETLTSLKTGK